MKKLLLLLALFVIIAKVSYGYENLSSRALIALPKAGGDVFLSWRFLSTDLPGRGFGVYRSQTSGSNYQLLTTVTNSTNYIDETTAVGQTYYYIVKASDDSTQQSNEAGVTTSSSAVDKNYFKIETTCPSTIFNSETERSIVNILPADLNGDGIMELLYQYEYPNYSNKVVAQFIDSDTTLWTYTRGISPPDEDLGCHNDAFTAWDLNNDGQAEVILRTSASDNLDSYTDDYVTILDGMTGTYITQNPWVSYGYGGSNNNLRCYLGIAYLNGISNPPSIIVTRGTYNVQKIQAFNVDLSTGVWTAQWEDETVIDASVSTPDVDANAARGAHGMDIGDIDGDGKDEILWGDVLIDDDGEVIWQAPNCWYYGHPDQVIMGDINPYSNGMEMLIVNEGWGSVPSSKIGISLYDSTGELIDNWPNMNWADVQAGLVGDYYSNYPGMEIWVVGDNQGYHPAILFDSSGDSIKSPAWIGIPVEWDDSGHDLAYKNSHYTTTWISGKFYDYSNGTNFDLAVNGEKAPYLCLSGTVADIFGDFREEIIGQNFEEDNIEIYIYTNTDLISSRKITKLADVKYREAMARLGEGYQKQLFEGGYYFNPPDNFPPSVNITSPSNGAVFQPPANITITAEASDSDGSVTRVEFYSGDTLLVQDDSSPYSFTWNNVSEGSYSLTAKAFDDDSASTISSAVNITVGTPVNIPPTVSINSPADSAVFQASANITVSAAASDSDGTVTLVRFLADSTVIGVDSTGSPYSIDWTNVSAGSYSLTAIAYDNDGDSTVSSAVYVIVEPDSFPSGTNIVLNPEFDDGENNWTELKSGGANGYVSVVTGAGLSGTYAARFIISSPGTYFKNFHLRQFISIQSGKTYRISIMAKANADRPIKLSIDQFSYPNTNYWDEVIDITTTAQTYGPYTFNCDVTNLNDTVLRVQVGGYSATTFVDSIIVEEIDLSKEVKSNNTGNAEFIPENFALCQNFPNPFNPETSIQYHLPESAHVEIIIYNLRGELVNRLINRNRPAGVYSVNWNGLDSSGRKVSSGIYLYSIKAVGKNLVFTNTKKMILLK